MPQRLSTALSGAATDVFGIVRTRAQAPQASLEQVERGLRRRSAALLDQIAKALHVSAEVVDMSSRSSQHNQINTATNAIVIDVEMTRC